MALSDRPPGGGLRQLQFLLAGLPSSFRSNRLRAAGSYFHLASSSFASCSIFTLATTSRGVEIAIGVQRLPRRNTDLKCAVGAVETVIGKAIVDIKPGVLWCDGAQTAAVINPERGSPPHVAPCERRKTFSSLKRIS